MTGGRQQRIAKILLAVVAFQPRGGTPASGLKWLSFMAPLSAMRQNMPGQLLDTIDISV
ncbi:MAG: hypothetical protein AB7U35_04155 [Sphingobium sp.]